MATVSEQRLETLQAILIEKADYLRGEANVLLDNVAGSVRRHDKVAMATWLEQQVAVSKGPPS